MSTPLYGEAKMMVDSVLQRQKAREEKDSQFEYIGYYFQISYFSYMSLTHNYNLTRIFPLNPVTSTFVLLL